MQLMTVRIFSDGPTGADIWNRWAQGGRYGIPLCKATVTIAA